MKTVYLIKTEPRLVQFECDPDLGLSFTTSFVDITFLNNIVINGDLRLTVKQKIDDMGAGKPVLWFMVMTTKPMNNENFQEAWRYATEVGAVLQKFVQMGISFAYQNAWSCPNVSDGWPIEETEIQFKSNGALQGICHNDPSKPTHDVGGQLMRKVTVKEVKADLCLVMGSANLLHQSHHIHITVPGTNSITKADKSDLERNVLEQIAVEGLHANSPEHLYLLVLYNKAISESDIFISFTLLYQMIEVVISLSEDCPLTPDQKDSVVAFLKSDDQLAPVVERIKIALNMVSLRTSFERFVEGICVLFGEKTELNIQNKEFAAWRRFRGKLTHPREVSSITEKDFVENYGKLREFWDQKMARKSRVPE